jgi:hypothetical protein
MLSATIVLVLAVASCTADDAYEVRTALWIAIFHASRIIVSRTLSIFL